MLEKKEMVSMRKKNCNITLSYRPRIPDLMRWTTAGSYLGIEIVRDSITPESCNVGWGDIVVITKVDPRRPLQAQMWHLRNERMGVSQLGCSCPHRPQRSHVGLKRGRGSSGWFLISN